MVMVNKIVSDLTLAGAACHRTDLAILLEPFEHV